MRADPAAWSPPQPSSAAHHEQAPSRLLALRLRSCLLGAGLPGDVSQDLGIAGAGSTEVPDADTLLAGLDAVISPHPAGAVTSREDWQRVLRRLWRHEPWREELDGDPGLRAALRQASGRSTAGLVSDVLASRLECRREPALITLEAGRLWIADERWDELSYHWEFSGDPTWRGPDPAPGVQATHASSLAQLYAAFAHGLDAQVQRGYLHHARYLGGIPASGFAIPQPGHDCEDLVTTLRRRHDPGPCVVQATPQLLPWSRDGWPSSHDAVVSALRAAVIERSRQGQLVSGDWSVALTAPIPLPAMRLRRWQDSLLVESSGLSALITSLGYFPARYLAHARHQSWSFATLDACGWSELQRHGCWQLLRSGAGEAWIAFPAADIPPRVPALEHAPAPWSGALPGPQQLPYAAGIARRLGS